MKCSTTTLEWQHTHSHAYTGTQTYTDVGKTERERGRQTVRQTYRQPRVLARLGTALYQHLADWLALTWVKGVGGEIGDLGGGSGGCGL